MMVTDLWDQSLEAFLTSIGEDNPTPGGGSVAAITGIMGCELVIMAGRISLRAQAHEDLEATLAELGKLAQELKGLADEDIQVFNKYMEALRLPKQTDERREALTAARQAATQVPLKTAGRMLDGLEMAHQVCGLASSHVVSDSIAGAHLLHAAIISVLYNVDINTAGQDHTADVYRDERRELAEKADKIAKGIPRSL